MLDLRKHYTQQPSILRRHVEAQREIDGSADHELDTTRVVGSGFITVAMLESVLRELEGGEFARVLVDLREISGYETGCATLLGRWLQSAHRFGVQRMALVASSSVVRTATRLASQRIRVQLRTFDSDEVAARWLAGLDPLPAAVASRA